LCFEDEERQVVRFRASPCPTKEIVMRSDMSKVIVERPRRRFPLKNGSAYPRGHLENQWAPELEDAPRMEAMGALYGDKRLNENLQPLVRFLRAHVGRPWNKVHSEIAERISGRSAVQKHVLDHLRHYVSEHVVVEGKTAFVLEGWHRRRPLLSYGTAFRFYVDPRSGQLRLAPLAPRKPSPPRDPERRVLTPERELRRIDGIWYDVRLRRIPRDEAARSRCFDVVAKTFLCGAAFEHQTWSNVLWRMDHYAASKAQLGKREITRYELRQGARR
jgi:hypothetical protein